MNIIVVQVYDFVLISCVSVSISDRIDTLVLEAVSLFLLWWSLLHPVSCLSIFVVDANLNNNLAILVIRVINVQNSTFYA